MAEIFFIFFYFSKTIFSPACVYIGEGAMD